MWESLTKEAKVLPSFCLGYFHLQVMGNSIRLKQLRKYLDSSSKKEPEVERIQGYRSGLHSHLSVAQVCSFPRGSFSPRLASLTS